MRLGEDVYGRIAIVEFDNLIELRKVRDSLFETEELPRPAENSEVQQGLIETSNVNPIMELTNMIEVSRTYDSVKNMISSENDRTKQALERLARPVQGGA